MVKVSSSIFCVLTIVSVVGILPVVSSAAPDATPAEKPAAAATPGTPATAAPTPKPTASEDACKAAVEKLRSGDRSGLEAFPEDQRGTLLSGAAGIDAIACLAVADDNEKHCDLLGDDARKACVDQWKVGRELKGVPKEKIKAQLMYRTCASNSPDMNCDVVRDAIGNKDAAKCKDLKEASQQTFCSAVVAGDAKKCDAIAPGAERDYCAAFAADDPRRCPKNSTDCIAMASGFAALKKGGLEGFQDIDARIAAASMGTKACAKLLGNLGEACGKKP